MNIQQKNDIRSKARLIYGLSHVLKDDIDSLRISTKDLVLDDVERTIQDTIETLERITDVIAEMEYIIYLNKH